MMHSGETTDKIDALRRQKAALADFGPEAFHKETLDTLLHRAAALISEALGVRLVKILELTPDGGSLLVRAGVNWKAGVVGHATLGAGPESPAGYALQTGAPVISTDTARETRFRIPQVLLEHNVKSMINVIITGEDAPYGVLEVDATESTPFDADDAAFLRAYANMLAAVIDRCRKQATLERQTEQPGQISRELRHRVKNLITVIYSMALQMPVEDRTARDYRDGLIARLQVLAQAEDVVSEGGDSVALERLVTRVLAPYRADPGRIAVEGAPLRLNGRQGRMLSLALHELATNAAKYGALCEPGGHVALRWTVEDGTAHIVWQERGGPPVTGPTRHGFGSLVIERACAAELHGETAFEFASEGLTCRLNFPIAQR